MTFQEFCLLLVSVLASALGQLFLKMGALKLGKVNSVNIISHISKIIVVPELLLGLSCYGFGAIAYILLLTRVNLSRRSICINYLHIFSLDWLFYV